MSIQDELTNRQKAAILIISLGPSKASEIFKHLREEEIEELTLEIANTAKITPERKAQVLQEFYEICLAQQYISEGGIVYAKEILEKALGIEKAQIVLSKLSCTLQVRPFDFLRRIDTMQILNFIQHEHPQTIALILSYLQNSQAAQILTELSPTIQADVAKRIAQMDKTSPDVIKYVEQSLEKKFANLQMGEQNTIGGIDSIVDILNSVDRKTEHSILETLDFEDPNLVEEIKQKMFVFEDIARLPDATIRIILSPRNGDSSFTHQDLALALKGTSQDLQDAIFRNVSKRVSGSLKEDMDYMGAKRRTEVEEAQQKIVNVIRKLQEENVIIIGHSNEDIFV